MKPTLAAPRGPWNGTPEIDRAAEAPIKEAISGLIFLSDDKTVQKICISFLKDLEVLEKREQKLEKLIRSGDGDAKKHKSIIRSLVELIWKEAN